MLKNNFLSSYSLLQSIDVSYRQHVMTNNTKMCSSNIKSTSEEKSVEQHTQPLKYCV